MNWLLKSLLGPGIWAVTFSAVYALHGAGCALGWGDTAIAFGTLHHTLMGGAWGAGMLACAGLLLVLPARGGLQYRLPRASAWIGLGATAVSHLPLLVASTC